MSIFAFFHGVRLVHSLVYFFLYLGTVIQTEVTQGVSFSFYFCKERIHCIRSSGLHHFAAHEVIAKFFFRELSP